MFHRHVVTYTCYFKTSSSAVAKRPRDISCLSVISFNSTKRRVESFIVSYVVYRLITACSKMRCSVVFGVTLRLLVINISSSSPAINAAAYYHNLRDGSRRPPATAFTTPACCSVNTGSQARYKLRIPISAHSTCIRRPR